MAHYDIAVVGAGPAGASFARLIGKKYKVLLLDRRSLDKDYKNADPVKCCGGLLSPDAQKMLSRLNLGLPKDVLVGPQLFVVRTIDFDNNLERYYQRHYINIDREKFDRWLVSIIPDAVDTRFGCSFLGFEKEDKQFKIKFLKDGHEYCETSDIIVGADGASSAVRKKAFKNCKSPVEYVAIQEWFNSNVELPYYSAIFDKSITDFYSWTISKDSYLLIGSALKPSHDAWNKFNNLKSNLKNYGFEFENRVKKEGALIYRPLNINQIITGSDNIALIGEAAGFISPSSSEGLSYALKSALLLAKSLESKENFLTRYKLLSKALNNNIVLKNLKLPFMYNSLIRKIIMKSGVISVDMPDI